MHECRLTRMWIGYTHVGGWWAGGWGWVRFWEGGGELPVPGCRRRPSSTLWPPPTHEP